jgi:O-antigen ligase
MLAAALMFADHPFVGVGPGMYPHHYHDYAKVVGIKVKETARQPHTLYLGLAAENGALGLICFALIVFVILRRLARTYRDWIDRRPGFANMAMGFILAIVVYLMTGIFLHFAYIRYFWLIVGLAAALTHIGTQQASAETALREYAMLDSSRPTSYRAAEKDVRLGS